MLHFLEQFNMLCIFYLVFPAILCLGGLLTWKLRGLQFSCLKLGFQLMIKNKQDGGEDQQNKVSRYEAVAGILAGNFGTGNIAGMAVAVVSGGPGSLVWIWIAALLGAVVQYASAYVGVKYRKFSPENNSYVGGPMACLAYRLKSRPLACLFCCFTLLSAFAAGNCVQVNCFVPLCTEVLSTKWILGVAIALLVMPVLIGGNNRILRFSACIIPFLAGFYAISCGIILVKHSAQIIPALKLIASSAFGAKPALAGIGGYTLTQILSTGVIRAVFATDCGNGMVSILQANSKSENPISDGLVTLLPPVIVVSVCSITMLVLLVSGAYASGTEGAFMIIEAFQSSIGNLGSLIVLISMFLFGYTTILTWFACAEKSVEYMIPGKRANFWLKALYILIIPVGGVINSRLIWALSDTGFAGMVILNSITLVALFKEIVSTRSGVALLKQQEKQLSMIVPSE